MEIHRKDTFAFGFYKYWQADLDTSSLKGKEFEFIYEEPPLTGFPYITLGGSDAEQKYCGAHLRRDMIGSFGDFLLRHPDNFNILKDIWHRKIESLAVEAFRDPATPSPLKIYVLDDAWQPSIDKFVEKHYNAENFIFLQ